MVNIEAILLNIFTPTLIAVEGSQLTIMPRGLYSMHLMAQLPGLVIYLFNFIKQHNPLENAELMQLVSYGVNILNLQPTDYQRANPGFNPEIYADFFCDSGMRFLWFL